jgi:NAD(P)-dependent dehydrogenase (short-subunit alcohol dehydrogenase family)
MKRYLITGASRGIGRAIATKLAGAETTLLLHGRNEQALARTCKMCEENNADAVSLRYDLSDRAQIDTMIDAIGAEPLDALINNAGIASVKPFDAITAAEWEKLFAVNVTAPFVLSQKLGAGMRAGSSIVNILSIAAKTGFPGWSGYCMSKFALEGFSQSLREELRPRGIRVINVYPAATNTDIWDAVEGHWPRDKMLLPAEIGDAVVYALSRPAGVVVENIDLLNLTGRL